MGFPFPTLPTCAYYFLLPVHLLYGTQKREILGLLKSFLVTLLSWLSTFFRLILNGTRVHFCIVPQETQQERLGRCNSDWLDLTLFFWANQPTSCTPQAVSSSLQVHYTTQVLGTPGEKQPLPHSFIKALISVPWKKSALYYMQIVGNKTPKKLIPLCLLYLRTYVQPFTYLWLLLLLRWATQQ